MAPNYDKPPHNLVGSRLYQSLHPKLAPYIDPHVLYHQLELAYFTYDQRNADMDFRVEREALGNAFQWDATCQGADFWNALDGLCNGQIQGAIELLEARLQ